MARRFGFFPDVRRSVSSKGSGEGKLSKSIDRNEDVIRRAFGDSDDLVIREMRVGRPNIRAAVAYMDGLADHKLVAESVIKPLTAPYARSSDTNLSFPGSALETIRRKYIAVANVKETGDLEEVLRYIGSGDCVLLIDGISRALVCSVRGWEDRAVEEPTSEAAIRGPRDGFTETLRTNTALLRRRIKDPRLRIEEMQIGRITQTTVAIVYLKGVANDRVVEEVRRRLSRIDVDGILESGYIEEYIEDAPHSPFPQLLRTERPDRVAGNLLEGRIAILTDGTPFVLIAPVTFTQFLTTSEDYYERHFIASFLRLIRFASFFVSLIFPSLYIAVTTFHQELLPTTLILSIASQRAGIPFPAYVEALMIEGVFEVLREAGVRLPKIIGQAISIVGVLVLGQVAVQAGLVSPFMVIVVSITAIASFATPVYSLGVTVRLARFVMMTLAAILGIFGIIFGLSALLIHLSALRSFGIPYLLPISPAVAGDMKDTIVRAPWWALRTRPLLVAQSTRRCRQRSGQMPKPRFSNGRRRNRKGEEK